MRLPKVQRTHRKEDKTVNQTQIAVLTAIFEALLAGANAASAANALTAAIEALGTTTGSTASSAANATSKPVQHT